MTECTGFHNREIFLCTETLELSISRLVKSLSKPDPRGPHPGSRFFSSVVIRSATRTMVGNCSHTGALDGNMGGTSMLTTDSLSIPTNSSGNWSGASEQQHAADVTPRCSAPSHSPPSSVSTEGESFGDAPPLFLTAPLVASLSTGALTRVR